MLDKTTKTKIDTARDILVGKVPNPQSQVDLITIAMIYKFMDDMDMQNIEMGGNRIFFTDDLEKYAWSKVLSKNINNWERIALYNEALDKLQIAKQIPELFRKIFKGAFLPFRDGATLTLFLNEIDGFSYSNSENLGNAFEYLLSIMGSQGDAGQFRTPRHIIDFIVDVVNPSKTDTILDPACGTAGFLISAYKHIMEQAKLQNTPLNPAEHQQLMKNIVGYDISPDMVKLASVNLFLHQFPQPAIYEYDTLSSEDRWADKFDVILANPPFMTPKGGIQPHSKFGVKANRAEVLFVDYMMEHLNLKGKAGFVVPEGIIFQSATAYKSLRKMMVEDNYLYAVVSLPSGVFNPYSGVKTSILLFDRELAKQTKDILFIKIDNDGYDLGAQRRPIKDNDLPEAVELLKLWQKSITSGTIADDLNKSKRVTIVSKEKLAEDGEYNLSASRYQQAEDFSNCQYEMVKLGDVCKTLSGGTPLKSKENYYNPPQIPWVNSGDLKVRNITKVDKFISEEGLKNSSAKIVPAKTVLVAMYGATAGQVSILDIPASTNQAVCSILPNEKINPIYLYYILSSKTKYLVDMSVGGAQPNISQGIIKNLQIPLPPMSVQEEIVKELDAYQAIIDGAQKVVDNWKPTFKINPQWEKVSFETLYLIPSKNGLTKPTAIRGNGFKMINMGELFENDKIANIPMSLVPLTENEKQNNEVIVGDLLFARQSLVISGAGKNSIVVETDDFTTFESHLIRVRLDNKKALPLFYHYYLNSSDTPIKNIINYANQAGIKGSDLAKLSVLHPSLEEQKAIVAQIEQEEQYVEACKKLIELNKQKISNRIKSIWNCND